jgi:catechol 2,3-dioxygenase-like lactoylglutathione lyase family enzyme
MLSNAHLSTIVPVVQIDRAREFYERKLGLFPVGGHADGSFSLRADDGSTLLLIPRPDKPEGRYTAMSFEVPDLRAEIRDLEGRGVRFEDYDLPGLKTEEHVFRTEDEICAWFKDTEGNILCVHQELRAPH